MRFFNELLFLFFIGIIFFFSSCQKEVTLDEEVVSPYAEASDDEGYFDFSSTTTVNMSVGLFDTEDAPISNVLVEIYTENPLSENGGVDSAFANSQVFSGITTSNGYFSTSFDVPTSIDSLYIYSYYIGIPNLTKVSVSSDIDLSLGGSSSSSTKSIKATTVSDGDVAQMVNGYYVLGDWDDYGIPVYSENVEMDQSFIQRINYSLPEGTPLGTPLDSIHPEYLEDDVNTSLILSNSSEVYATFIHDGGADDEYNVFGYYTYSGSSPSTEDLSKITIVFPNASYSSKDYGALNTGDKVQLFYIDEEGKFKSQFPSDIQIGFFFINCGWNTKNSVIGTGEHQYYSNFKLNSSETQQNVLLYDESSEQFVLGWEDTKRKKGDDDYNDLVVALTLDEAAVCSDDYPKTCTELEDSDEDGVPDIYDDYPHIKGYCQNIYSNEGEFGTVAFEDKWPVIGDYDFNDVVLNYRIHEITYSCVDDCGDETQIAYTEIQIVPRASGASYHNGFGVVLGDLGPDAIESINGQSIEEDYIDLNYNGTESGQDKAVVICFDDFFNLIAEDCNVSCGVNTYSGHCCDPIIDTLTIKIGYNEPVLRSDLGSYPYNPFIIINQNRGKEVHLRQNAPTALADTSYFNTGDDASDINAGIYYRTAENKLPWAVNIPISFNYPIERANIKNAYLKLQEWAEGDGETFQDWYVNLTGYRNTTYIYCK